MKTESYVERWAREQKENTKQKDIKAGENSNEQNTGSEGQAEKKTKKGRKQTCVVEESDNK